MRALFLNLLSAAALAAACSRDPQPRSAATAVPAEPSSPSSTVVRGQVRAPRMGTPALVILKPEAPRDFPPQTAAPVLDQIERQFIPDLVFARTGQPAAFHNSDDQLHNVRVRDEVTLEGAFNVAIPVGERYVHTFTREGFYEVWCDIHPEMRATLVVTSTPYTAVADHEGKFVIYDVAPGAYTATVQIGAGVVTRNVNVAGTETELIVE